MTTNDELSERLEALERAMEQIHAQYVAPKRSDSKPTPTSSARVGVSRSVELPPAKDVRAWARSEGLDVTERGKLPPEVVEAYKAAHEG